MADAASHVPARWHRPHPRQPQRPPASVAQACQAVHVGLQSVLRCTVVHCQDGHHIPRARRVQSTAHTVLSGSMRTCKREGLTKQPLERGSPGQTRSNGPFASNQTLPPTPGRGVGGPRALAPLPTHANGSPLTLVALAFTTQAMQGAARGGVHVIGETNVRHAACRHLRRRMPLTRSCALIVLPRLLSSVTHHDTACRSQASPQQAPVHVGA